MTRRLTTAGIAPHGSELPPVRRTRVALFVACAIGVSVTAAAPAPGVPLPTGPALVECDAPKAVHVPGVDTDDEVTIDVALLADRAVTVDRAAAVVESAQASFASMNLVLRVASVEHVTFVSRDPGRIVDQARAHFGGVRPAGVDTVMVLTSADLTSVIPRGERVAGMVDCLGGVAFRNYGFGVAEDSTVVEYQPGPLTLGPLEPPSPPVLDVFAHEVGHVFGATHESGNCVEGALVAGPLRPCTLMSNQRADLLAPIFGSGERPIIRGHAEAFARP